VNFGNVYVNISVSPKDILLDIEYIKIRNEKTIITLIFAELKYDASFSLFLRQK
jgi:hypothetical protein